MSRTISANLESHIKSGTTTLATIISVERTDGTTLYLTDHDAAITYDGDEYEPSSIVSTTNTDSYSDMSADTTGVEFAIDATVILGADITAGLYDDAIVKIAVINYESTADGIIKILNGRLSDVSIDGQMIKCDIVGVADKLKKRILREYTYRCSAVLGDSRCGVTLSGYTTTGSVTGVASKSEFTDSTLTDPDDTYKYGAVTFTSGNNSGLTMDVQDSTVAGVVTLIAEMPYDITVSDTYEIVYGCDKDASTCSGTFSNIVNFRGFPHIPGKDEMMKAGGQ